MGRRIFHSRRKSHETPPVIEVDERDDESASPSLEAVLVTTPKVGVTKKSSKGFHSSIRESRKRISRRQVYRPPPIWLDDSDSGTSEDESSSSEDERAYVRSHEPKPAPVPPERAASKIWTEKFESSDSDPDDSSKRGDDDNSEDESKDNPGLGFCAILDPCVCGNTTDVAVESDEKRERDWVAFLADEASKSVNAEDAVSLSSTQNYLTEQRNPSTQETAMVSTLSDACSSEYGKGDPDGVEHTLDDFHSSGCLAKTPDLDKAADRRRMKNKKRIKKRSLSFRRKRGAGHVKQQRRKERREDMESNDEMDGQSFRSAESTSTNGEKTVISIRHKMSEEGHFYQRSVVRRRQTNEDPFVHASAAIEESATACDECSVVHTSVTEDSVSPHDECATSTARSSDSTFLEDEIFEGSTPGVVEGSKSPIANTELVEDLQSVASKEDVVNDTESLLPTPLADEPVSQSVLKKSRSYESLDKQVGGADSDGDDDDDGDLMKQDSPTSQPGAHDAMLDRMLSVIESGINFLSFPDIPSQTDSKKRVSFAPDVKFNDINEEHDYPLDYTYSEPEFGGDDDDSFEDAYYAAEDNDIDDDEAFFDEAPTQNVAPAVKRCGGSPNDRLVCESGDAIIDSRVTSFEETLDSQTKSLTAGSAKIAASASSTRGTRKQPFRRDPNRVVNASSNDSLKRRRVDENFNYDDNFSVTVGKISTESGIGYLATDIVEEDEGSDERSVVAPSSSYKTIDEMQLARAASPLEPSIETLESLEISSAEKERRHLMPKVNAIQSSTSDVPQAKDYVNEPEPSSVDQCYTYVDTEKHDDLSEPEPSFVDQYDTDVDRGESDYLREPKPNVLGQYDTDNDVDAIDSPSEQEQDTNVAVEADADEALPQSEPEPSFDYQYDTDDDQVERGYPSEPEPSFASHTDQEGKPDDGYYQSEPEPSFVDQYDADDDVVERGYPSEPEPSFASHTDQEGKPDDGYYQSEPEPSFVDQYDADDDVVERGYPSEPEPSFASHADQEDKADKGYYQSEPEPSFVDQYDTDVGAEEMFYPSEPEPSFNTRNDEEVDCHYQSQPEPSFVDKYDTDDDVVEIGYPSEPEPSFIDDISTNMHMEDTCLKEGDCPYECERNGHSHGLAFVTPKNVQSPSSRPSEEREEPTGGFVAPDSDGIPSTKKILYKDATQASMMCANRCDRTTIADSSVETLTHAAIVESYLNMKAECSDRSDCEIGRPNTISSEEVPSIEATTHDGPTKSMSANSSENIESDKAVDDMQGSAAISTNVTEKAGASIHDTLNTYASSSDREGNKEDFTDWLHQPETREKQTAIHSLADKSDLERGGWPSLPNEWLVEDESEPTDLPSDAFSNKSSIVMERIPQQTRRRKKFGKIADKKESLQLSLQGFARAKPTSGNADWANFNNAPFRDLEVAPFDEC